MANNSFTKYSQAPKFADQNQDGEALNLQDFQARLATSIGNVQAMVESWLPKELQDKDKLSSEPSANFDLDSYRPRNSKSGLGSAAPKQPASRLTTSKLHSQLTKKSKNDAEATKPEGHHSSINHKQESDEEEDSRTSTFNKKRPAPSSTTGCSSFSLLQQPSKKSARVRR